VRECARGTGQRESGEELGGGAGPRGSGLHEGFDGGGHFVRSVVESGKELGFGNAEGGSGGGAPRGEVGHAGRRGEMNRIDAGKGSGGGGAQRAEECGAETFEIVREIGFGAAIRVREDGHADDESTVRQGAVGGRLSGGEQDGARKARGDGFGAVIEIDGSAGGDTAERIADGAWKSGHVIKGKDAVGGGKGEQSGGGGRQRLKSGCDGIDERTQQAGGGRLSATGRSSEYEHGRGNTGAHTGKQPRHAAQPRALAGEVEQRAQLLKRCGGSFDGSGQRLRAARGGGEGREAIGDTPGAGGDFDDVAGVVGEVEGEAAGERRNTGVDMAAR
jgi:hypothetical protein